MPVRTAVRRFLPVVFFVGGFAWDALTLGRSIRPVDLFLLFGYLAAAAAILVVMGRGLEFRGSHYLDAVLQFLFGGIFSALFIFYFLSSSDLPGIVFVVALAALLLANEFLESAYSELTLSWAFFSLGATMFFNFALAHLFRSISPFWFYAGTAVAVAAVLLLRSTARSESSSVKPAIGVAVLLTVLHLANVIPPVPLVKREMLVAHEVTRVGREYRARIESPGWRFWRSSSAVFHRSGGERVYCFTSVFVPRGIATTIRHRWQRFDASRGGWVTEALVPFRISGGRESGFRGYTWKRNLSPGRWRVVAESESGAAIGIVYFRLVEGDAPSLRVLRL